MHELAITEDVIAAVTERLAGAQIAVVTLEIGALSGVVSDSVRFCFDLCTDGTTLEGSRLEILDVPGRARCRTCESDVELTDFIALCACGSANLEILSGEDLRIKQVEVV